MISVGNLVGCAHPERLLLSTPDLNGDGIRDRIYQEKCPDGSNSTLVTLLALLLQKDGTEFRLQSLSPSFPTSLPRRWRFAFDRTDSKAENYGVSFGMSPQVSAQFFIGDLVQFGVSQVRITGFGFEVDEKGMRQDGFFYYVAGEETEICPSKGAFSIAADNLDLKLVSGKNEFGKKIKQIMEILGEKFPNEMRALRYAHADDLREPYRSQVAAKRQAITDAVDRLSGDSFPDRFGQDLVRERIFERVGVLSRRQGWTPSHAGGSRFL